MINPSLYFIVEPSPISVRSTGNVHGRISSLSIDYPYAIWNTRVEEMEVDMN